MPDPVISAGVAQRVLDVIATTQKIDRAKVTLDSSFEELGLDSMDAVNILFALENEFDISIPDEQARSIRSIREMVDGVAGLVAQASAQGAG